MRTGTRRQNFGVAKTMMSDIFGTLMPLVVTAAFASTYVLMISVFNMIGRFFWASTSDYIGRLLTAWSIAGVLGPLAITSLRRISLRRAIEDLAARVDPATFGAPIEQLDRLLEAKTLSIARLMEIAPEGAVDPTPSLYNTTMYAMAALLVVAFFANLLMRPVSERHHYRG